MAPRLKRILAGVAIGAGVLAAGLWVLIHTLGWHEERYQGKPLSYWLKQIESQEVAVSNRARGVLETQVIPQLIATMFHDTNDSSLRLGLIERLNGLPGVQILFVPADGRRGQAVESLAEMGPRAKAAIPDLIKAVKGNDSVVRGPAARALGQIHSEPDVIIPLLMDCLDSPLEGVPEGAAGGLGEFGPLAKVAIPKLIEMLKVREKDLHAAVQLALKKIDPEATTQGGVR